MAASALTHWYGEQYKNYHTASDTFMKRGHKCHYETSVAAVTASFYS